MKIFPRVIEKIDMAVEEDLNASSSSHKDDKIQEDLFRCWLIADLKPLFKDLFNLPSHLSTKCFY